MKQIDIDRYNKGQDKFYYQSKEEDPNAMMDVLLFKGADTVANIPIRYNFLLDPEWGWREMFDKDPDYQKEFWDWMEKREYAVLCENAIYKIITLEYKSSKDGDSEILAIATNEMLTGYILSFMQERMTT